MDEVLTTDEVARRLKVSPLTVRRHLLSGKLPGYKVGTRWRIKVEDIEKYYYRKGRNGRDSTRQ